MSNSRATKEEGVRIATRPPSPYSSSPGAATLTVVQITDVYTLENFPSLRTLIRKLKAQNPHTISLLTGDFLAPYLLSTIDQGEGMMRMVHATPIDYVSWGNHEADVDHGAVCRHVRGFQGRGWLNTNMKSHDAMAHQKAYDVVEVASPDGSQVRRIGLCAVLSDDPHLYAHFPPHAPPFGGARIEDPWAALRGAERTLREDERCDVVLPLQHTYVPDDHRTCREFDFPVVLSGHDHHVVDEVVAGTRLLKPGCDGVCATVLHLTWPDAAHPANRPHVAAAIVRVAPEEEEGEADEEEDTRGSGRGRAGVGTGAGAKAGFPPDPALRAEALAAYEVLAPLRRTELASVPRAFRPLSSAGARGRTCSMGSLLCTYLRDALNEEAAAAAADAASSSPLPLPPGPERERDGAEHENGQGAGCGFVDAVLLMGGNVRGGRDYEKAAHASAVAAAAITTSAAAAAVGVVEGAIGGRDYGAPPPPSPCPAPLFFSLEALKTEVQADEVVGVVAMPGWLLSEGVRETHRHGPRPGWFQCDAGVTEEDAQGAPEEHESGGGGSSGGGSDAVVTVGGAPLEPQRTYRVATKVSDLTNGQSPPFTAYYKRHPELLPPPAGTAGSLSVNIHDALLASFARNLWRRLLAQVGEGGSCTVGGASGGGCGGSSVGGGDSSELSDDGSVETRARRCLLALDADGDGCVSPNEVLAALASRLRISVDPRETALARRICALADVTGNGRVELLDLRVSIMEADNNNRKKAGR